MAMRFDVVTLFPEMFADVLGSSILARAARSVADPASPDDRSRDRAAVASYHLHDLRAFSADPKHRKVDKPPYGGGAGMVLQCQPLWDGVKAVEAEDAEVPAHRVFLTPTGRPLTQRVAEELAGKARLLLICGHYEGYDQRVLDRLLEEGGLDEVSVGDVVLSGGELPAMLLIDAVVRLLPGALGDADSAWDDSFSPGVGRLLDHPHYTHPPTWAGREVPAVLRGGDHGKIAAWRSAASRALTEARRPDLLAGSGGAGGKLPVATFVDRELAAGAALDALASLHAAAYGHAAAGERVRAAHVAQEAMLSVGVELGGEVVGHAMLSRAELVAERGLRGLLWLSAVAVGEAYRRRGLGTALVREAVRQSKDAGVARVFVWVEGERALDWERLGFGRAASAGFYVEGVADAALWMLDLRPGREIEAGALVAPAG